MKERPILEAEELAFREGYKEGYANGASDAATYEFGGGNKHLKTRQREQDSAWEDSEAKASIITPCQTK